LAAENVPTPSERVSISTTPALTLTLKEPNVKGRNCPESYPGDALLVDMGSSRLMKTNTMMIIISMSKNWTLKMKNTITTKVIM
jgi:hypothetical protein